MSHEEPSIGKDLDEVLNWFFSRERRAFRRAVLVAGLTVAASIALAAMWGPMRSQLVRIHVLDSNASSFSVLVGLLGMVAALVNVTAVVYLKARLIRIDRRLSIDHARFYQKKVERLYAAKELKLAADRAQWEREREEWQAEKQNELYALIIDQVERGILGPRPGPRDGD